MSELRDANAFDVTTCLTRRRTLQGVASTIGAAGIGLLPTDVSAATSVGLVCMAHSTDTKPKKAFSLNFTNSDNRWTQGETGSTSEAFRSKSGTYNVVALTTYLVDGNGSQVAIIRNFNPDTAVVGKSGNDGKAVETARIFDWKVEIVTA